MDVNPRHILKVYDSLCLTYVRTREAIPKVKIMNVSVTPKVSSRPFVISPDPRH